MKKTGGWILALLLLQVSSAVHAAGLLQKVSDAELKQISLPGYSVNDEQVFKVASGPLAGKAILFASFDPTGIGATQPKLFVTEGGKVIDSQPLPNLVEGWNIVDVAAVTAVPGKGTSALRVLAVMTLEPISNRTEDYWDQSFVFDLASTGKIEANKTLNQKIADKKPRIKTIEALKSFLGK